MLLKAYRRSGGLDEASAEVRERLAGAATLDDPFPHVVVDRLLPARAYGELADALPQPSLFKHGKSERKLDLDVKDGGEEFGRVPERARRAWTTTRDRIFRETVAPSLAERFADAIRAKYEWLFGADVAAEILADGLTSTDGRVMGRRPGYRLDPHLDSAHFAVTCLLYLSSPGNERTGALSLYRPEREPEMRHASTYYPEREEGIAVTEAKRVPIHENLFVAFVNLPTSLHGLRVDEEHASADFIRFVYQTHLVPRGLRVDTLHARLADPHRSRWERYANRSG